MTHRLLALALLVVASPALADVIELKTGQRVEGTFKQGTAASISVEVAGQTITIEVEKVRAIYFGAAPAPAAQQPSARDDAMKALKAMRSVAQGGIAYRDYAPRVSDAKIVVDRYLSESQDSPERTAIREAMEYYTYASNAWNSKISSSGYEAIGMSPLVKRCPALTAVIESHMKTINTAPAEKTMTAGIIIGLGGVPAIWSCAADKLAEVEKLLGSGSVAVPPAGAPLPPAVSGARPAPEWCKAENVVWQGDRCVEKK